MAKRKPNTPKLTLGIELPPEPSAAKDWTDDDDTTGVGPVDDLQPIGRVTPVPCAARYENNPDTAEDPCEDCGRDQRKHEMLEPLREADEEPTLLGPFHEPNHVAGAPGRAMHCGVPVPEHSAPEAEWKAFHEQVELSRGRVAYIDATAIALYARGFPLQNVYAKAAALWEQRQKEGFK